jgi:hypothetical protein
MDLIHLLRPAPKDLSAYYARLTEADALRKHEYPVFISAKTSVSNNNVLISWVETIEAAAELFQDERDWADLGDGEIAVLLGLRHGGKDWGLLGNMGLAGTAVQAFKRLPDVRSFIRGQLSFVLQAKHIGQVAANVIGSISALPGFGGGIATRLIALARPENAVSVNNGSAPGLAKLLGWRQNPLTLATAQNYPRLLGWLSEQPWHNSPEPTEAELQRVWKIRAALIDVFVYEPPRKSP